MREIIVTDHALVRWLERYCGIDMEYFRAQVADAARPYVEAGAAYGPLADDLWMHAYPVDTYSA